MDHIEEWPSKLFVIDAQRYAFELGMSQSENVILLGALLALGNLPISIEKMEEVITNRWPRVAETNIKALHVGISIVSDQFIEN